MPKILLVSLLILTGLRPVMAQQQPNDAVPPVRIVVEAEDMRGVNWKAHGPGPGWQVGEWGRDLYQNMTFGGVWASRLRTAMTDAGDGPAAITSDIDVPKAGTYKLWVKYECPPFFNYAFGVRVEGKDGKTVFDKTYGLLDAAKHYCFTDKLTEGSLYWTWGIDHDAAEGYPVTLREGSYRLTIYKTQNPAPAAARSIDTVLLTTDLSEISSPRYSRYPLLDELRRANHVYFRFRNKATVPISIAWNHWNHRYPDFYYPFYRELVTFHDAEGHRLDDSRVTVKGDWPDSIPPGGASVWYDLGPTMNVESTSPYQFTASPTVAQETTDPVPFGIDIALEPRAKKILKAFELGEGESELTVLVQPDLHTKDGLRYTRKIIDIFREITDELNQERRLGPIPRKMKLFAGTGRATTRWTADWDFETEREFRLAMGLNTLPGNQMQKPYLDRVIAWRRDKGGIIPRSLSYHHSTDMAAAAKLIKDANVEDYFHYVSFGDEIGLPGLDPKDETLTAEFQSFVREHGQTPEQLGLPAWDQVKPLTTLSAEVAVKIGVLPESAAPQAADISSLKKLYWYSVLFREKKGIESFAAKTAELKGLLGPEVHTSANLGGMHPFYWVHQTSFIESFKHHAMTLAWSEDYTYCMPEASALVVDFLASYLRKGASYHDTRMMFYCMPHYPGNTPELLLQNAVLLWANNIKDLDFFSAAFDGFGTENHIAYRGGLPTFKTIRTLSGMAGLIEDHLVQARPESTPVAMLLSQASDVWEIAGRGQWDVAPGSEPTNVFQEERKNLWYALRHGGYRVDFVTENDVADGLLDSYKVLYITGQNMERRAAEKVKPWIEAGGVAFVTAGAARKDEFDQPMDLLDDTFGRGAQESFHAFRGPLRAKLELLFEEPLDRIVFDHKSSPVLCVKETFKADGGAVIARYTSDGQPAWVRKTTGKGLVYCGGTLPGQAYIQKGLPVRPMGKGGADQDFCHFTAANVEPVDVDETAGALILLPLTQGHIEPDVVADHRGIVFGRLKGPHSTVIPVVNLAEGADGPLKKVSITVRNLDFVPSKVWSCFHKKGIKFRAEDGALVLTLKSLKSADVIVMER